MATSAIIWLALFFCLLLSFILSGMEAGVFALSRLRIRRQTRPFSCTPRIGAVAACTVLIEQLLR